MELARWTFALGVALAATPASAQDDPPDFGPSLVEGHPQDNWTLDAPPDALPSQVVKILRTTNKAQINRYVPKVYTFEHVNPYAVIRFVRRVMEIEEGAWQSFAAPDMDSGKLLVVCPEYQIPGLDRLMATIDREGLTTSAGSKRVFYRLRHRDAFDPDFLDVVELEGTPTVQIIPDVQTNSLLVDDAPSGTDRVEQALVESYDLPTPQVEALVTVYEVDLTDDGRIGLDYVSWKNGPGRNLFALGAFAQKEKITELKGGPGALLFDSGRGTFGLPSREFESTGANSALFYDVPSAYFDFLVAEGQARIMTKSKLVALNRSTAQLQVGDQILFFRADHDPDARAGSRLAPLDPYGDLDGGAAAGAAVVDHPDDRVVVPGLQDRELGAADVGFFLEYTPIINQRGATIALFLSLVSHTGYAADGTPVLASRQLDTVFKVPHDGRTITIGGLVRKQHVDSANKMPWLGDIPVLGYLFGGESRLDRNSAVFVTFSMHVVDFGVPNVADDEADLQRRAAGLAPTRTLDDDPGIAPGVK